MTDHLPIDPTDEPTTREDEPATDAAVRQLVAVLADGQVPVTDVPDAAGLTHERVVELMDDPDAARRLAAYQWMIHWRERLMSENLRMAGLTHLSRGEKAGETERRACNDLLDFQPTPPPERPAADNDADRPMTVEQLHRAALEIFNSVGEPDYELGEEHDPSA